MPFGPYDSFEECVISNSDKASPEGYCAWLEHQITGSWPGKNHSNMPEEAWSLYRESYAESMAHSTKKVSDAEKEAHEVALKVLESGGWNYSRIGWVKEYAAPKFKIVSGVRVFAVGTWTDSSGTTRDWTEQDVDGLVAAFNAGVPGNVVLKAGHTPDSFNLKIAEKMNVPVELVTGDWNGNGQVGIGRMSTLERRGNLLIASFERVPEPIGDLIEAGLFSTVSVEIEDDISGFASAITAVALLGAEEPAVDEATLDRALVFGGRREKARVVTFAKDAGYLEQEFNTLLDKLSETIKGMRGAPVFRALMSNLRERFDQITNRKREHQSSDIPPEVTALAVSEYQGNIEALINWASGKGFDACVAELTGKEGITDPVKVCGWLKSQAHQKSDKEANMPSKLSDMRLKMQEPPVPPVEDIGGELMEGMMAIAAALGLNEEATVEDILTSIEQLKQGASPVGGEMSSQFNKATVELQKANERIEKLEHNERVHGYIEQTRLFTALPGKKPEEIAVELAEIEETQGKERADSMLSTYSELNKMGEAATLAIGSSKRGLNNMDYEAKLAEYMKEHPDSSRSEAHKVVMRSNPSLRYNK